MAGTVETGGRSAEQGLFWRNIDQIGARRLIVAFVGVGFGAAHGNVMGERTGRLRVDDEGDRCRKIAGDRA